MTTLRGNLRKGVITVSGAGRHEKAEQLQVGGQITSLPRLKRSTSIDALDGEVPRASQAESAE